MQSWKCCIYTQFSADPWWRDMSMKGDLNMVIDDTFVSPSPSCGLLAVVGFVLRVCPGVSCLVTWCTINYSYKSYYLTRTLFDWHWSGGAFHHNTVATMIQYYGLLIHREDDCYRHEHYDNNRITAWPMTITCFYECVWWKLWYKKAMNKWMKTWCCLSSLPALSRFSPHSWEVVATQSFFNDF